LKGKGFANSKKKFRNQLGNVWNVIFPQCWENRINFQKNSPQNLPQKTRSRSAAGTPPTPKKSSPKTVPAALRERN
jgi:hypothetical protein